MFFDLYFSYNNVMIDLRMNNVVQVVYPGPQWARVKTRKVNTNAYARKNAVIMELETIPDCRLYVIRAPREGVVVYSGLSIQGLNIKPDYLPASKWKLKRELQRCKARQLKIDAQQQLLAARERNFHNVVVASISDCPHSIVLKDMCATCGKDLREKDGQAGQRRERADANVSMIHHVPELIVSNKLAKEIGTADQTSLLQSKKLVLLVDLDQTIIHTTNRPFKLDRELLPDAEQYGIFGAKYTTKLRPYTREFLKNMSKLYEMHIITYGQRLYAHKIAEIIDPDRSLFRERIMSRDELFSATLKTGNLKALFPNGDDLVAVIDDRADVWEFAKNLIRVKPYRFFEEVGDINAPARIISGKYGRPEQLDLLDPTAEDLLAQEAQEGPSTSKVVVEANERVQAQAAAAHAHAATDAELEAVAAAEDKEVEAHLKAEVDASEKKDATIVEGEEQEQPDEDQPRAALDESMEVTAEDDCILQHIETVLTNVHTQFYDHYNRTGNIRPVKMVVDYFKKQILRGVTLALSGMIPPGTDFVHSEPYRLMVDFGAKLENDITDNTTHLVAAKWGTLKVHQAVQRGLPVLRPGWMQAVADKWIKPDEKEYELTKDTYVPSSERPRFAAMLNPELMSIDTIRKETLMDMSNEVDAALSDDDEDSEEEADIVDISDEEDADTAAEKERKNRKRAMKRSADRKEQAKRAKIEQKKNMPAEFGGEWTGEERDEYDDFGPGITDDADADPDNEATGDYDDNERIGRGEGGGDDEEDTMDVPLNDDEDEDFDEMAALVERQMSED